MAEDPERHSMMKDIVTELRKLLGFRARRAPSTFRECLAQGYWCFGHRVGLTGVYLATKAMYAGLPLLHMGMLTSLFGSEYLSSGFRWPIIVVIRGFFYYFMLDFHHFSQPPHEKEFILMWLYFTLVTVDSACYSGPSSNVVKWEKQLLLSTMTPLQDAVTAEQTVSLKVPKWGSLGESERGSLKDCNEDHLEDPTKDPWRIINEDALEDPSWKRILWRIFRGSLVDPKQCSLGILSENPWKIPYEDPWKIPYEDLWWILIKDSWRIINEEPGKIITRILTAEHPRRTRKEDSKRGFKTY